MEEKIGYDLEMNIILSTRNPSKAEQIKAVFAGSPFTVLTLNDAGIEGEATEDGMTLEENALKKAEFAYKQASSKNWVMADDTGIFIETLNGEPGIKSARWSGEHATSDEILTYCLKRLEGKGNRMAYFETVVALISPQGEEYIFSGRVEGRLDEVPHCKPQPKMPYSAIFMPNGDTRVWAEMTVDEENKISHRGKAFAKVKDFLLTL